MPSRSKRSEVVESVYEVLGGEGFLVEVEEEAEEVEEEEVEVEVEEKVEAAEEEEEEAKGEEEGVVSTTEYGVDVKSSTDMICDLGLGL